jgi:hypothetical protein
MCLASKKQNLLSNPIHKVQSDLMELPITHGFAPGRHLVRYDCPIYKKPGDFRSEKLHLLHGVEATENKALKISADWGIKRLIKQVDDIFYKFQFGRPHQTCLNAIILKEITINSLMLTKTPSIIIDIDATGCGDKRK